MSAPTRACVCALAALALVCLDSASSDEPIEQREVTFDIRQIKKEMQPPDQDLMQRELDLSELLSDFKEMQPPEQDLMQRELDLSDISFFKEMQPPEQDLMQRELDLSDISFFKEEPSPGFSPRASRPRTVVPVEKYHVQFPLARPSPGNIRSICLHGDRRPRYPESYFPASGFGVYKRQADAVNTLEAWFTTCCGQNQTEEELLCCAAQAWEKSVRHFCKVGFSIKAPHFHCCKLDSNEVLPCFDSSAPNPDYNPSEESPVQPVPPEVRFNFDPSTCPRTSVTPHSIRDGRRGKLDKKPSTSLKVDLDFPLAAPTDSNFESICRNLKLRPRYNTKCLDGRGYALVVHQAKSMNHLEKEFKRCCNRKEGVLSCAQLSWRQELKKFCSSLKHKRIDFSCCAAGVQFECFENLSTDPDYNKTIADSLSLSDVCDTHKVITKRVLVGFPFKTVVNKCCHLSPTERSACVPQSVKELFEATCSSRKSSPPSIQRCCRLSSAECFNKVLMDSITKVQRNKKRCPVS